MKKSRETQMRWFQLFRTNWVFWSAAGIMAPFMSAYYKSIHLTSTQIGMLFAVAPICAICIQPVWAVVSDRLGKRRLVLIGLAVCTAMAALLYYLGRTFAVCLLATVTMAMFSSALQPLCDAILIDRANAHGCNFATIRIGGTLGYAVIVLLMGNVLERWSHGMFALSSAGYLIFALTVAALPREEETVPSYSKLKSLSSGRRGIFDGNEVIFVLLFAFVMSLGLGFCGSFTGVYAVELGHSQKMIGLLSCISALSEVPVLLFAQKMVKRFGEITILVAAAVLISLRLLLIGMGSTATMISGQLLQGLTYMSAYYCCTRYISTHVKPGKISQGQSTLTLVQSGLASVTGNLFGGYLVDLVGTRTAFFSMAAIVFAVSLLVSAVYLVYNRKK